MSPAAGDAHAHTFSHIHVALSVRQSVCSALMCVPSRIQHPDITTLKGVIIFLWLPPKKWRFYKVTSLQFDKSDFLLWVGCEAGRRNGRRESRVVCGGGGGGRKHCLSATPRPCRLNDAPRQRIQIPSPLAFNFSLILHSLHCCMVTRAAVPQQRRKTSEINLRACSLFTALRPVAAIILSWQLRPSNLIAEILELQRGPFEGMSGKKGCPSQYSCQSTRPSSRSCPLSVFDAHACAHTYTHTHRENGKGNMLSLWLWSLYNVVSVPSYPTLQRLVTAAFVFSLFLSLSLCL